MSAGKSDVRDSFAHPSDLAAHSTEERLSSSKTTGSDSQEWWKSMSGGLWPFTPRRLRERRHSRGAEQRVSSKGPQPQHIAEDVTYGGESQDGRKHGMGKLLWPDGSVYHGQFRDDKMHGDGFHLTKDGYQYRGQWQDGKMHGHGICTFPSGKQYEGLHADGQASGQGILQWPDGRKYEGEFVDGRPHGMGTLSNSSGPQMKSGQWKRGRFVDPKGEAAAASSSGATGGGAGAEVKKASRRIRTGAMRRLMFVDVLGKGSGWHRPSPTNSSSSEEDEEETRSTLPVMTAPRVASAFRPPDELI